MELFIVLMFLIGYLIGFALGAGIAYGMVILYWHVTERLDSRRWSVLHYNFILE